jgi:hypothetical protein
MRSREEAARLIVYATLENSFLPGSYVDGMCQPADLVGIRTHNRGFDMHAAAFPVVKKMLFYAEAVHDKLEARYLIQADVWKHRTLMFPPPVLDSTASEEELLLQKREIREMVSARLWEVSESVLKAWKKKKSLFSLEVGPQSESKLM